MLAYLLLPTYLPTAHYSLQDGVEGAGGIVTITAECDRYLYNMMRIVSGTLVEVGLGRLDVAGVASLLATEDRGALQDKGGPRVYKVRPHRRPRATRRNCSAPLVAPATCLPPACHLPNPCPRLLPPTPALLPPSPLPLPPPSSAASQAPARGLCLSRCFYPGDDLEHDQAWPLATPAQAMPPSEPGDGGAAAAWPTAVAAGCSTANTASPDDSRHQIKN